jgi:uncharacterized membrane protein HdeD (DUF308 family)
MWKQIKRSYLITSLCAIICGLLLLLLPDFTLTTASIFIGSVLLIYGVFKLVEAIRFNSYFGLFGLHLITSMVPAVLGVILILQPRITASILPFIMGIILMIYGIAGIEKSISLKQWGYNDWWLNLIVAILTIIFGLVAVINPFETATALIMAIGAMLMVVGISNLIQYFAGKHKWKQLSKQFDEMDQDIRASHWFWF